LQQVEIEKETVLEFFHKKIKIKSKNKRKQVVSNFFSVAPQIKEMSSIGKAQPAYQTRVATMFCFYCVLYALVCSRAMFSEPDPSEKINKERAKRTTTTKQTGQEENNA
jgi:hypothetical protein